MPFKLTVFIPTWINISTPLSVAIPIACLVGKSVTTPSAGAKTSPFSGTMATPLPSTSEEKASSSISESGTTFPSIGEVNS
ncbi:hypothetical protein D3C77_611840 [compost metagenome]